MTSADQPAPGWFGPLGLASVFALPAIEDLGGTDPRVIVAVNTFAVTIVFSVIAHGVTARTQLSRLAADTNHVIWVMTSGDQRGVGSFAACGLTDALTCNHTWSGRRSPEPGSSQEDRCTSPAYPPSPAAASESLGWLSCRDSMTITGGMIAIQGLLAAHDVRTGDHSAERGARSMSRRWGRSQLIFRDSRSWSSAPC